jgi:hypothetical protein
MAKKLREILEGVKEPTGDLKNACWKGYTAVGMKMKNGRKVPNCVPTEETEIEEKYGKGYKSPWDKIEKAKPGIGARIDAHAKELDDLNKKYKQITDKDKKEVKECKDDCSCSCNDVDEDAKGHKSPSGGLTQKGREYVLSGNKAQFAITQFSLHDEDVNYQISKNLISTEYNKLPKGFVPDITGDNDDCINSIAAGIFTNSNCTIYL